MADNGISGSVERLLAAPDTHPEAGIETIEVDGVKGVIWDEEGNDATVLSHPTDEFYFLQSIVPNGNNARVTEYLFSPTRGIQYVHHAFQHADDDPVEPSVQARVLEAFNQERGMGMLIPTPEDQRDLLSHIAFGLGKIGVPATIVEIHRQEKEKEK
ncbi:MAG: hypothetical protein ACXWLH_06255 [Candidatus Saccharimonadales bacterium]